MQERFVNNDMCSTHNLMCSTHNEGKSVITERFIQTLQAKIYKKVAANDSKPYVSYLNKLVDQYNNTYHDSIDQKPINANYSASTENIKTNPKAHTFKVNDIIRITKYKNIFSKGYNENWSRESFVIDSAFKTNPWIHKVKDLNGELVMFWLVWIVNNLVVYNLKTVPVGLNLSDVMDNEIVKNTNLSSLKTKVNNLENKYPDATSLIHVN